MSATQTAPHSSGQSTFKARLSRKKVAPHSSGQSNSKVREINLSRKTAPCPRCNTISKRHSVGHRRLREVGLSYPTTLEVTYSKHYCVNCRKHFSLPMDHLARPSGRFTNRVRRTSISLVTKQEITFEKATQTMWSKYHVRIPPTTLHDWVVAEMKID